MHSHFLWIAVFALTSPQDTDGARQALAILRASEATIDFDDKTPGKRVVGVNL